MWRALPASIAGFTLLGAAALVAAPSTPPTSPRALAVMETPATVAVVDLDGSCEARTIPLAQLARIEEALAEEAQRLGGMAQRLMADAAAARLAEARERVPAFGAWAYGWVQSYITSYRVLGRLVRGLAASMRESGDGVALAERVMEEVSQPVREEFHLRVLPPDLAEALARDMQHASAMLDQAWQAALARAAAELAATPRGASSLTAPRLDLAAAGDSLAPALASTREDMVASLNGGTDDPSSALLRSVRPMAARIGAVVLRASEASSFVAAASAVGYAFGGAPGVVLGAASGVGASWTIDWGLNRVDSALHREAFEAQAMAALQATEDNIAERAGSLATAALGQRREALRPGLRGCGMQGAQR